MNNKIDPKKLNEEVQKAITKVVDSGIFIQGEMVRRFEQNFAKYLGVNHCVTCGNGTDALEMSLEVLSIGQGDEVILPAFGWVSPAMAVKRSGATPVFVDVEYTTGNIDISLVQAAISERTKAIIPIHLFGNPCDIISLRKLCGDYKIYLIEDCAQAHGAEVQGKKVGSFGELAVFSFYPTKNLGAFGDGGALVTNNDQLAEKLRALRDYGRTSRHEFNFAGRNSRLDEIQAAVLGVKLRYLDRINEERRERAKILWEKIALPKKDFPVNSVFHQFVIKVKDRDEVLSVLKQLDIHYPFTIPETINYHNNYPIAKGLSEESISLPLYTRLSEIEITYICDHLKSRSDQYEI